MSLYNDPVVAPGANGKFESNAPSVIKPMPPSEIGAKGDTYGSMSMDRFIEFVLAENERNILRTLARILNASDFVSCAAAILGTEIRVRSDE
jgi:hypothetical protein